MVRNYPNDEQMSYSVNLTAIAHVGGNSSGGGARARALAAAAAAARAGAALDSEQQVQELIETHSGRSAPPLMNPVP